MAQKNRGYKLSQLILASFGFGACSIFWAVYNSYVPLILDTKLTAYALPATLVSTLVGFIMTIDNLFGLIFQPYFGRKSDSTCSKWGKRMPYLIFGVPVCAVLFVLIPIAGEIAGAAGIILMMAVIILFNFVMSTWRAPAVAIMPDIVPPKYQSEGNSIVNLVSVVVNIIAMCAASILGALGYKDAIASGDYRSLFLFGSIAAILFLLLIMFTVKWPDNRGAASAQTETKKGKKESLLHPNVSTDVKKSMYIMMIALFFISGALDGGNTYATLYATKTLSLDVARVTALSSIAGMGAIVFAVPAGVMGTKFGRKKTIFTGLVLLILCRIVLLMLPIAKGVNIYVLYTVIMFVLSASSMLVNINTLPIMLSIGGEERFGAFTGYYYTATFTAAVVCPTLIGFFVGIAGTYNAVNAFCIAVQIIAAVCVLFVKHGETE